MVILRKRQSQRDFKTQYKAGTVSIVLSTQDQQTLATFVTLLMIVEKQSKKQRPTQQKRKEIGLRFYEPISAFFNSCLMIFNHPSGQNIVYELQKPFDTIFHFNYKVFLCYIFVRTRRLKY